VFLPFIILLQDLPAEVEKRLPDEGKIVKLWSRHFARLHCLLPIRGKALIFGLTKPN
jgi:hypothetical protein